MSGQKCYYPNGDDSKQDDIPCGEGDGVACCPENWECLGNGVCHLAAQNYYSRFTCTDKSWQSDGCPKFCTEGASAAGNQAVQECDTDSWCCDGERPELVGGQSCCKTSNDRFSLGGGKNQKPVGDSAASDSTTLSPPSSSSSSSSASSSSSRTPSVSSFSSVITQGGNSVSTLIVTSQVTASASSSTSVSQASTKPLATIIAPAIVVPLLCLSIAGLLIFLLLRRRRRRRLQAQQNGASKEYGSSGSDPVPMYKENVSVSPLSPNSQTTATQSELEGSSPNPSVWSPTQNGGHAARWETPNDVFARKSNRSRKKRWRGPVELPAEDVVREQEKGNTKGEEPTGLGVVEEKGTMVEKRTP